MSALKHIYEHTFADGERVKLIVDFSGDDMILHATPKGVDNSHPREYVRWTDAVVVPDMMNRATPRQIANAIRKLTQPKTT